MERFWLMGYRAMCATLLFIRISVWCIVLSVTANSATKRERKCQNLQNSVLPGMIHSQRSTQEDHKHFLLTKTSILTLIINCFYCKSKIEFSGLLKVLFYLLHSTTEYSKKELKNKNQHLLHRKMIQFLQALGKFISSPATSKRQFSST